VPLRYPLDIEAIKHAWPISDVLEKLGIDRGRNNLTNCPFCYEQQTTPARTFSYATFVWHCFRCEERGNAFQLVMKLRGINFMGSLHFLSSESNWIRPITQHMRYKTWWRVFPDDMLKEEAEQFKLLNQRIGNDLKAEIMQANARFALKEYSEEERDLEIVEANMRATERWERLDQIHPATIYYWKRVCDAKKGGAK